MPGTDLRDRSQRPGGDLRQPRRLVGCTPLRSRPRPEQRAGRLRRRRRPGCRGLSLQHASRRRSGRTDRPRRHRRAPGRPHRGVELPRRRCRQSRQPGRYLRRSPGKLDRAHRGPPAPARHSFDVRRHARPVLDRLRPLAAAGHRGARRRQRGRLSRRGATAQAWAVHRVGHHPACGRRDRRQSRGHGILTILPSDFFGTGIFAGDTHSAPVLVRHHWDVLPPAEAAVGVEAGEAIG